MSSGGMGQTQTQKLVQTHIHTHTWQASTQFLFTKFTHMALVNPEKITEDTLAQDTAQ